MELIPRPTIKVFKEVCIPVLEKHDGEVAESMDLVNKIGSYGYDLTTINELLSTKYQDLRVWINVEKATKYMKVSAGYIRRLARKGIPTLEAKKHPAKGWSINLVSIIDYLIRTKKVQIA